jgi:nitrite reductase/ring-hydroxylating ferredoxin subunit
MQLEAERVNRDPAPASAAFVDVCKVADLWDGEMESFEVGGAEVLLLKHEGRFVAFQGVCPHQQMPLVEGKLEKGVLTCRAHLWQFNASTGHGINPSNCRLKRYPVQIADETVQIGVAPLSE